MSEKQRIVADPAVMLGKPVVGGTRITVESILERLAAGEGIEQLLDAHPRLTCEGVLAAVAYAAESPTGDPMEALFGEISDTLDSRKIDAILYSSHT